MFKVIDLKFFEFSFAIMAIGRAFSLRLVVNYQAQQHTISVTTFPMESISHDASAIHISVPRWLQ